jgi:pimeloyl-ACP methyl ester carboxylesterase
VSQVHGTRAGGRRPPDPAAPGAAPTARRAFVTIPAMQERVLDLPGRRLRYLVGGDGPPLVLCHGFLGSAENFETWFDELTARRTLVVPDLPGCGGSSPLEGRHSSAALAAAVEPLLDHLSLGRFDLGGLCLGSPVACALARRRPGAVGRLLLHTPLLAPELVRRRFHLQVALMTAPGVFGGVVWLSRRRLVSDLYKRLVVEGDDVDRRAAETNFANQCRVLPRAAREWLSDGLRVHDAGLVAAHPEPVLLLAAAGDRVVDTDRLRRLAGTWGRCRLALVEDAGHGWSEAYVRRQLEVLGAFLDGRPLPATAGEAT